MCEKQKNEERKEPTTNFNRRPIDKRMRQRRTNEKEKNGKVGRIIEK